MPRPDESPPSSPADSSATSIGDSAIGRLFEVGLTPMSEPGARRIWAPPAVADVQRGFPQYEVAEMLGRGGMGAVFKAWHRRLERWVAIKILPEGTESGAVDFAERFQREAQALARLNHPGIVAVYDAGQTADGLPYIIMECVEGTDVGEVLAADGRLPAARAVEIAIAVCGALEYAHRQGVIHRDIKPSNVLLDREGAVKVADFGLAGKAADADAGLRMGTPDFMSPEALTPGMTVDHRADVFAVGAMLYQMLTGTLPPRGRFDPPSRILPGLERTLDEILERALQPQAEARFASALEMKDALSAVCARVPARPVRKWALVAALILALAGGSFLALRLPPTPHPPARWVALDLASLLHEHAGSEAGGGWWQLPGAKTFHPPASTGINRGLRATFRGQRTGTRPPEMLLRDTGLANFNGYLHDDGTAIAIQRYDVDATPRYRLLGRRALPQPIARGTPYTLEFIAVENELTLRFGETILSVRADVPPEMGRSALYGTDAEAFRDVQVLDLDGLPEAEARQRAGLDPR